MSVGSRRTTRSMSFKREIAHDFFTKLCEKVISEKRLTHIRAINNMADKVDVDRKPDIHYLSKKNFHPRDKHIKFQEEGHIYFVKGKTDFTSVTKFVHSFSKPFDADAIIEKMMKSGRNKKYQGMSPAEIKKLWRDNGADARKYGTAMHFAIECYYNSGGVPITQRSHEKLWEGLDMECAQFEDFKKGHTHLTPYRTEWCVYHEELKLTGCVDMVFQNASGGYDIYDWKRSKEIKSSAFENFKHPALCALPDSNFWQYTLQLNMYKFILESKYGIRIDNLYLVSIHPEQSVFKKYSAPVLKSELRELLNLDA